MTPGQRIAAWRRLRGLSVRQLASAAQLHYSALSRMERGHQEPRATEIERIASVLGITMPQFFGALAEQAS